MVTRRLPEPVEQAVAREFDARLNRDDRPLFGYRSSYYRGYFPQTQTRAIKASAPQNGARP